jgi:hypothetical protein
MYNMHVFRKNIYKYVLFRYLESITQAKTIAKLEKYQMYGIDTSRDKSHDFDLGPLAGTS